MKTDRVFLYAIGISVLVHLVAIGIIGRGSGLSLAGAAILPVPRAINVDLVASPDDALKPPVVAPRPESTPDKTPAPNPFVPSNLRPGAPTPAPTASNPTHGNPLAGGPIDVGTPSSQGDIPGLDNGTTTPGVVPNPGPGRGNGSGVNSGTGTPEPPKNPVVVPVPVPVPTPTPRMLSVKVCDESGMLPGPYCKQTRIGSFIEGAQPTRICNQCKAPEPPPHVSRLADRALPELLKDTRITVPSSVDEGLSLTVEVEYTVNADGDVTNVQVTRSSGIRALDRAIVSAASGLKYKPAVQDGIPRGVKMTRTYKINT